MEQVQIVTCDPDIKSVADLKGKTVSIGASGSGVYYNALDILAAYGLTEDDITAQYQDFGNSADSLQDGKIDAAFVVAGAPHRGRHHPGHRQGHLSGGPGRRAHRQAPGELSLL